MHSKNASDKNQRCPNLDLEGRCILFVGGRKKHVCHFRQMVEGANGSFSCHDGGVEDNLSRLKKLSQSVDLVMFPVDNISHAAQNAVKDMCRKNDLPFMPLRSSGVGSFMQALNSLAAV